jgi:hypothetical protein
MSSSGSSAVSRDKRLKRDLPKELEALRWRFVYHECVFMSHRAVDLTLTSFAGLVQ